MLPRAPGTVCATRSRHQGRPSSLRCGRSTLTPTPRRRLPAAIPGTPSKGSQTSQVRGLDRPRSFRDDLRRCVCWQAWCLPATGDRGWHGRGPRGYGRGIVNDVVTEAERAPSIWQPMRDRVFRALWLAVLGSQIGTWMQTVGAQWLLVDEPNAAALVSLVQTAMMLPILLLAVPAGVLADSLDRRRMLIVVQVFQAATGAVLTAMALAGQLTPALLLTLTFVLGCGGAMTIPTYQ